jgi:hypothetical protein
VTGREILIHAKASVNFWKFVERYSKSLE